MTNEEREFSFKKKHDYHTFYINDPITLALVTKIVERSQAGQEKYGATLQEEVDTDEKNVQDYLIDIQEELVDAVNYANAAIQALQKLGIKPLKLKL